MKKKFRIYRAGTAAYWMLGKLVQEVECTEEEVKQLCEQRDKSLHEYWPHEFHIYWEAKN